MKILAYRKPYLTRIYSYLSRPLKKIDSKISVKIFGNTAGFFNNIFGSLGSNKFEESLKINGFKKLKKCPPELLKRIKEKYDLFIEDKNYFSERSFVIEKDNKISFTRHIEGDKFFDQEIKDILDFYKPEITKIFNKIPKTNLTLYRNFHIPKKYSDYDIFSNFWHNDRRKTNYWKLFINLSDVDTKSGPLNFIPSKISKEINRKIFKVRKENLSRKYSKFINKLVGPAGTAILINTEHCLHKATNPENKRDMFHLLMWQ